jgi:hypothetical protein
MGRIVSAGQPAVAHDRAIARENRGSTHSGVDPNVKACARTRLTRGPRAARWHLVWLLKARPIVAMASTGRGTRVTLVNAMHITASVFINDDAGPRAGCTTAPERTPVQDGQDRRRASEAGSTNRLHFADHGPGGGGRSDQRPTRLWYLRADLIRPDE